MLLYFVVFIICYRHHHFDNCPFLIGAIDVIVVVVVNVNVNVTPINIDILPLLDVTSFSVTLVIIITNVASARSRDTTVIDIINYWVVNGVVSNGIHARVAIINVGGVDIIETDCHNNTIVIVVAVGVNPISAHYHHYH